MARIVFDASSIVGALLKPDSVPERALLLARARDVICLSDAVEARFAPSVAVQDCRDAKDNKYLELALAAGATTIVSSDGDLLARAEGRSFGRAP